MTDSNGPDINRAAKELLRLFHLCAQCFYDEPVLSPVLAIFPHKNDVVLGFAPRSTDHDKNCVFDIPSFGNLERFFRELESTGTDKALIRRAGGRDDMFSIHCPDAAVLFRLLRDYLIDAEFIDPKRSKNSPDAPIFFISNNLEIELFELDRHDQRNGLLSALHWLGKEMVKSGILAPCETSDLNIWNSGPEPNPF